MIAACAEGYAFPTNLDRDPPLGGLAPQTQAQLMAQALAQGLERGSVRKGGRRAFGAPADVKERRRGQKGLPPRADAREGDEGMCRALIYLGQPALLDDLLFQPDSALINQAYMPKMLRMLSLAGFGMMAWDHRSHDPGAPYRYCSPVLPVFDRNLKSLARKTRADCVLAHVRGVPYSTTVNISEQNCHPFHFPGTKVALAHNGDIYRIAEMKGTLLNHISEKYVGRIVGSTDSEWLYALLVSRLPDPAREPTREELIGAVEDLIDILRQARRRHAIDIASSCNLFIATGTQILGLRYCFDFGRYRTEFARKYARGQSDLSQHVVHARTRIRLSRRRVANGGRAGRGDFDAHRFRAALDEYRPLARGARVQPHSRGESDGRPRVEFRAVSY